MIQFLIITGIMLFVFAFGASIGFLLAKYRVKIQRVEVAGIVDIDRFKIRLDTNGKPVEPPNLRIGEFEERGHPVMPEFLRRKPTMSKDAKIEQLRNLLAELSDLRTSDERQIVKLAFERDSLAARVRELESQLGDTLKATDGK